VWRGKKVYRMRARRWWVTGGVEREFEGMIT